MCRRPVGRMPLITRFVFASELVVNRSPWKFWRAAILPACRRRAAVFTRCLTLDRRSVRRRCLRSHPESGSKTPALQSAYILPSWGAAVLRPYLQTQVAGDYQALDLAGAFVD